MERSQRTRKDFYLQGKSTVVVIGAASGVKHPTPSPAQHHPPAFPLGKGRKIPPQPKQSAPSAALPASCRRVILQVAQLRCGGDPRPLPEMAPPPAPGGSDAGGGAVPGQRGVGDSGGSGAGRWQRRIPASPQRSALRSAARSRVRGGGWGGRLRPEQREEEEEEVEEKEEEGCALKLAALFFSRVSLWCAPPPPPHSGTPKAVPRMQLWGFPSVQKAFPPRCAPKLHPKGWERLRLLDPKGFGSDRPRKASWRSASRLSLHPLPSPSSERRGLEILHPESNVYVRTRT